MLEMTNKGSLLTEQQSQKVSLRLERTLGLSLVRIPCFSVLSVLTNTTVYCIHTNTLLAQYICSIYYTGSTVCYQCPCCAMQNIALYFLQHLVISPYLFCCGCLSCFVVVQVRAAQGPSQRHTQAVAANRSERGDHKRRTGEDRTHDKLMTDITYVVTCPLSSNISTAHACLGTTAVP